MGLSHTHSGTGYPRPDTSRHPFCAATPFVTEYVCWLACRPWPEMALYTDLSHLLSQSLSPSVAGFSLMLCQGIQYACMHAEELRLTIAAAAAVQLWHDQAFRLEHVLCILATHQEPLFSTTPSRMGSTRGAACFGAFKYSACVQGLLAWHAGQPLAASALGMPATAP